jgi:hypothetical protein
VSTCDTRQTSFPGHAVDHHKLFAECHLLTLGKQRVCWVSSFWHTANHHICLVLLLGTRQTVFFFLDFASPTFSTVVLQYLLLYVEVLYIFQCFYYISSIYFS